MRADRLTGPRGTAETIFDEYDKFKCSYTNTQQQCQDQGFVFQPLVVESHGGGWSLALRKVVDETARRQQGLDCTGAASLGIGQRLSIGFHAENACAALRRLSLPLPSAVAVEGVEWADEGGEGERVTEPDSDMLDG